MKVNRYLFVLNPKSNNTKTKLLKIINLCKEINYDIFETTIECNREALRETAVNGKFTHVIAVGGDGTIHDVLNSTFGLDVVLGVFPLGSGNDFARDMKIPTRSRNLAKMLENDKLRTIDCGKVQEDYFINYVSFGFDAEIAEDSLNYRRILPSSLSYIPAVYHCTLSHNTTKAVVDGQEVDLNLIAIHNGRFYGGGMAINPEAKVDDGLLDVCCVAGMSRKKIWTLFPLIYIKKLHKISGVKYSKATEVKIKFIDDVPCALDGELYQYGRSVEVKIMKDSVRLLVP